MPLDFDSFYKKKQKVWSVKQFHGKILSALLKDLSNKNKDGLPGEVSDSLYACLTNSLEIINAIRDGSAIFLPYSENVTEFRRVCQLWTSADGKRERIEIHDELMDLRKGMNATIDREMRSVRGKEDAEKREYYKQLHDLDNNLLSDLLFTFKEFSKRNIDHFPELARVIN